MAYQGHCRLRSVHVDGLIKRYRQLTGHIAYLERYPLEDQNTKSDLIAARDSLGVALTLCASDLDLASLDPIRYVPPAPLPGVAMTRAVLAQLRLGAESVTAEQLVAGLTDKHALRLHTDAQRRRFASRVLSCVANLFRRQLIRQSADGQWSL